MGVVTVASATTIMPATRLARGVVKRHELYGGRRYPTAGYAPLHRLARAHHGNAHHRYCRN